MNAATEQKLIDRCTKTLQGLPQARVDFLPADDRHPQSAVQLSGDWGQVRLTVRLISRLTPDSLALLEHQLRGSTDKVVLFCPYVGPKQVEQLKQRGVQFVDAEGNTWLNQPPLYIEISGRKRQQTSLRPGRAFTPTGLKLIYSLLQDPTAIRQNYRMLAQRAGIALGAVGTIIDELKRQGFVEQIGSRRRDLCRTEALLYRWQLGYLEQLRPRLILETCRLPEGNTTAEMVNNFRRMGDQRPLVSGEMGAALLAGQDHFSHLSLHIDPPQLLKTLLQLRLTPDPEGEVTILSRFGSDNGWRGFQPEHVNLADPLLIHGELAAKGLATSPLSERLQQEILLPRLRGEQID